MSMSAVLNNEGVDQLVLKIFTCEKARYFSSLNSRIYFVVRHKRIYMIIMMFIILRRNNEDIEDKRG